jgi:hypothetical protein
VAWDYQRHDVTVIHPARSPTTDTGWAMTGRLGHHHQTVVAVVDAERVHLGKTDQQLKTSA